MDKTTYRKLVTKRSMNKTQEAALYRLMQNNYQHDEMRDKLRDFMTAANTRDDFHEPDEQEVTAVLVGRTLDNAMGDEQMPDDSSYPEVMDGRHEYREKCIELRIDKIPICRLNLASLLALAANKWFPKKR